MTAPIPFDGLKDIEIGVIVAEAIGAPEVARHARAAYEEARDG